MQTRLFHLVWVLEQQVLTKQNEKAQSVLFQPWHEFQFQQTNYMEGSGSATIE